LFFAAEYGSIAWTIRYYGCTYGDLGAMRSLSLKLPEALDARLEATAKRSGQSKSELMRQALEAFLGGKRGVAAGSCLDLAGDLAGCLRGPGDLSFNKKRLRGYGR
jgi:hypothetical protein